MVKIYNILINLAIAGAVIGLSFFNRTHFWLDRLFYICIATIMLFEFISFICHTSQNTPRKNKSLILFWVGLLFATTLLTMFVPAFPWILGFAIEIFIFALITRIFGRIIGKTWYWETLPTKKRLIVQFATLFMTLLFLLIDCTYETCPVMPTTTAFIIILASIVLFQFGVFNLYNLKKKLKLHRIGFFCSKIDGIFDRFGHVIYLWLFDIVCTVLLEYIRII